MFCRYFSPGPYLTYENNSNNSSHWKLVSDDPLVNTIKVCIKKINVFQLVFI